MNKLKELGKRIKENFKKNKVVFFICLSIWIITICVTLTCYNSTLGNKATGNFFYGYIISEPYELNKETKIIQEIPTREGTKGMAIHFCTYARENKGNIFIEVKGNNTGTIFANEKVNVNNLQDNAFYSFNLNQETDLLKDSSYIITLSSDSEIGSSVGVQKTYQKRIKDTKLLVNAKTIEDEDLIIRYISESITANKFYLHIIIPTIVLITLLIFFIFIISPKKEFYFAILVLILGVIFTFIITPYSIPDEYHHTTIVNEFVSKITLGDSTKIDKYYLQPESFEVNYNRGTVYRTIIDDWNKPIELTGEYVDIEDDISGGLYSAYYIPQIIGVLIGRLLSLNYFKTFYLGRFFNLIFYTICIYIAIKKTPVFKTMFGVIACLPIFVQQAASYSYDSFINGLCFISAAYLFKWMIEEERINIVDYAIVFVTCLALAPAKYVYGFFALLYWFIPTSKFGNIKNRIIFTSLLCIPMLWQLIPILGPRFVSLFKSMFSTKTISASTFDFKNMALDVEKEIEEIQMFDFKYSLAHPKEVIVIVLRTLRYNIKTWFYGSIGRYLSSLTITLPLRLIHFILAIIVSSILLKEDYFLPLKLKITIVIICGIMGLFTVGGMLLYWTSINDLYIQGVQGRYFSPLLPYFFSIFNNRKIAIPTKFDKYINFAYLIAIFEVIVYVLSYTFVN